MASYFAADCNGCFRGVCQECWRFLDNEARLPSANIWQYNSTDFTFCSDDISLNEFNSTINAAAVTLPLMGSADSPLDLSAPREDADVSW